MKTFVLGVLNASTDPGQIGVKPLRLPQWLEPQLSHLQPLALLVSQPYGVQVFFLSGLTKLRDWSITRALFEGKYHVPVLSPALAA